ncbi:TetR/AcrR family transcriptional regulator [Martelella sp. HB161492]|uniref:TetR/AcrR family transcriptional regulator n=1 Tax=Martelella sp. HB161492 TaxID=2720726 RepID=UPI00158FFB73|nr:TetR/AcrR family transcriptional regulator [Martelella sp. HB161492]
MPEAKKVKKRVSIGAARNPDSQDAILNAAEEILLEVGLSGFTIEAVARRARAGKPTIYRWWPSKAALLLDVYQRQKPEDIFADTGNTEDDLFLLLRGLMDFWHNTPGGALFRSVLAAEQSDLQSRALLREHTRNRHQMSAALFHRAKARGELEDWVDPLLAAEIAGSFAWGRLLRDELAIDDETLRRVTRQIIEGLRRKKPA